MLRTQLLRWLRPHLSAYPAAKRALVGVDGACKLVRHSAAAVVPRLIGPSPERLTVAITASCNLRCAGCRYGRDYMPGKQLPQKLVSDLLDDAALAGFPTVRLYGGEPLLHPALTQFIEKAISVGIKPVITTNGLLLGKKIDDLFGAGLRVATLGYYGFAEEYDEYVARDGAYAQLENAVAKVRDQYGMAIDLQINYLLMTRTCSVAQLTQAWRLALKYNLSFQLDLLHYSLPYFSEGQDRCLQFTPQDGESLRRITDELLSMKASAPSLFRESALSIRSIPDWALKGPEMAIPCDAYKMLWVGADGSVRLCYAAFPLGNLHATRLRDLFGTPSHRDACKRAFRLDCPRCHCKRDSRIEAHLPSRLRYSDGRLPILY